MKVYDDHETGNRLIVGSTAEIKAVYHALCRAWQDDRWHIAPSHLDKPVFVPCRIYGIEIVTDEGYFMIHSASGCMKLLGLV